MPVIIPRSVAKTRHLQSPDTDTPPENLPSSTIVGFSKHLYSSLATENVTTITEHFRPAFKTLNQDGMLGDTLSIIYDMRITDLQTSIKHARKMKEIIDILAE